MVALPVMVAGMKTGLASAIRAHIAKNGPSVARSIADATGFPIRPVCNACRKMALDGRLEVAAELRTPGGIAYLYRLGRDLKKPLETVQPAGTAKAAAIRKVEMPVERGQKPVESRGTSEPSWQTVEEFVAAGGQIERLPSQWVPRDGYPPPRFSGAAW